MDKEISDRIMKIEERLDFIETAIKNLGTLAPKKESQTININDLLALPSSLQKSMLAVQGLNEATASEVAGQTNRDRTVENIYLNQLARLGYLTKERKSRKIYFKVLRYY